MSHITQGDTATTPQSASVPPEHYHEMLSYVGSKIVKGYPMSREEHLRSQEKWVDGQETHGEGYRVIYEDGYQSWSPKDVFERCYRPITMQEKRMI